LIVAIVPYKGDAATKSRLGSAMSAQDRSLLGGRLRDHVLEVASSAEDLAAVALVSTEPADGVHFIADPGLGLNQAVAAGVGWAEEQGAEAVLILPADLPFLTVADVAAMIAGQSSQHHGVVAPSKDGGTGGLLLRPPRIIQPAFGYGSARTHRDLLEAAGVEPVILHRSGLALDIDSPEDLDLLGDELLDIVWNGGRHHGGRSIDGPYQAGKHLARANLDE
jgi:2-phospho-L-lactate/phosphoenolpyruvate guanylyltransferase